jgi:hypothetical protein
VEVQVVESVDVDVAGEQQWLGLGDDYVYGLGYARREKSEALGLQIEKELQKRGYGPGMITTLYIPSWALTASCRHSFRASHRR